MFDLDHTLICGDSEILWGEVLVERGLVEARVHRRRQRHFEAAYRDGSLDIFEFLQFQLQAVVGQTPQALAPLLAQYRRAKLQPLVRPGASRLLQQHRDCGHRLWLVTATSDLLATPAAQLLGVDELVASPTEINQGRYTGRIAGPPNFRDGKLARVRARMQAQGASLGDGYFYSDSHNDLPLLEAVGHPVTVHPDGPLRAAARERGWPVITLDE